MDRSTRWSCSSSPSRAATLAFNRWHDETHAPDILGTIGGYVGANRFRRAEVLLNRSWPWGYMTLYDMPKGSLARCLQWSRDERDEALAVGRPPECRSIPS